MHCTLYAICQIPLCHFKQLATSKKLICLSVFLYVSVFCSLCICIVFSKPGRNLASLSPLDGYEGGFARRLRVSIKHHMQRSPVSTVGQADAEGPRDSHKARLLTGPELPVCMHVYIGVIFA